MYELCGTICQKIEVTILFWVVPTKNKIEYRLVRRWAGLVINISGGI